MVACYIVNPDLFFVFTTKNNNRNIELQDKLNAFYKAKLAAEDYSYRLLVTEPQLACGKRRYVLATFLDRHFQLPVAKFPEDGEFYRAKILSVLEKDRKLRVLYVDYGNVADSK